MIEKFFIPTYRRNRIFTFEALSKTYQDKVVLVVDEEDYKVHSKNYECIICPVQGKGPEGSNPNDYGLPATRAWLSEYAKDIRYGVMDDDIKDFIYTIRPENKTDDIYYNTPLTENQFDEMFGLLDSWMDEGYVYVGLDVTWNPPISKDEHVNFRSTISHFYNGPKFPRENIDWTSIKYAEDYYVLLQLLTSGYQNKISTRYRVRPFLTNLAGGCETTRSLELNNQSSIDLAKKFPEFVKITPTILKKGPWAGLEKYSMEIAWKKAYKSSQNKLEFSLDDFFS